MSTYDARLRETRAIEVLLAQPCTLVDIAEAAGVAEGTASAVLRRVKRLYPVQAIGTDDAHIGRQGKHKAVYRIIYPEGRTCAHEGCGTRLRRTNPSDYCEAHGGGFVADPEPPKQAAKRRYCPGVGRPAHRTTDMSENASYCRTCWREYTRQRRQKAGSW